MIHGASELIRVHGFNATSFKDVWEHTQTPRGSVYPRRVANARRWTAPARCSPTVASGPSDARLPEIGDRRDERSGKASDGRRDPYLGRSATHSS
jgi:hypothetical protein